MTSGPDTRADDPLRHRVDALELELKTLRASASWRLTGPLRAALRRLRRPRSKLDSTPIQATVIPPDRNVELLASSAYFQEAQYAGVAEATAAGFSPAEHYLKRGEEAGLAPSSRFDPRFYRERYGLADHAGNCLVHYLEVGLRQGLNALPAARRLDFRTDGLIAGRPILVLALSDADLLSEATHAAALVDTLALRANVVVLAMRGGAPALVSGATATVTLPDDFERHDAEDRALARAIVEAYAPDYLIAIGPRTAVPVAAFEQAGLPVVALIADLGNGEASSRSLNGLVRNASGLVVLTHVLGQLATRDVPDLAARAYTVLNPLVSLLPTESGDRKRLRETLSIDDGTVLIAGSGAIIPSAGIDLFVAVAAMVRRRARAQAIRFVWLVDAAPVDRAFRAWLDEQIRQSDFSSGLSVLETDGAIGCRMAEADILFMPAREAAVPEHVLSCAGQGTPVVCFAGASGVAEALQAKPGTRDLVVPFGDLEAAADLLAQLVDDPARRDGFAEASRTLVSSQADRVAFVDAVDRLGRTAMASKRQQANDCASIEASGVFHARFYSGLHVPELKGRTAIAHYLRASALVAPRGRALSNLLLRRPVEGFHPLIYTTDCADYDEASGEDPLAHFIGAGKPSGRWTRELLRPDGRTPQRSTLRVAVQGHFYYPELLPEFLARLARNETPVDVFLTTTSEERARRLERTLADLWTGQACVTVVPNRGRDIGPMLAVLDRQTLAGYDIVGHFHGKRSLHVAEWIGETWRSYVWENLLGGDNRMVDIILAAFGTDPALGLVFQEDPHLHGWDWNRRFADELAGRMKLSMPLPNHFEFPLGNMFWARPAALTPLLDLGLTWDDYPREPITVDGTMLHALERLMPFIVEKAGFGFKTTYVSTCVR